ncbi:MAG: 2-dehydropantoate 2-reductase [Myxococcota bacterium]|nr:2-dehydropantoate 2-reductase [Myxococcota bacterium]
MEINPQRLLVVGCGGLGGTMSAWLGQHEPSVVESLVTLSRNTEIVEAVEQRGLRTVGAAGALHAEATVVSELGPQHGPFDWIVLTTQPPQVEEAARAVLSWLAPEGVMVCLQNGLCEDRVAAIAGPERVFGAVVGWGASMPEPGLFDRTSSGGFTIGRMDGVADPRLEMLALLFEIVAPVNISDNLAGARWSKLAINCAISSLGTLGGDRLGTLMRRRLVRRLALELMTETVRVAHAEGVNLEKVSGTLDLDWLALTPDELVTRGSAGILAKHAVLLAVGTRFRRMRSSMLAAIERGREPAVDFLNGEVVERGRTREIDTPMNQAARELVWKVARGQLEPGPAALEALRSRMPGRAE